MKIFILLTLAVSSVFCGFYEQYRDGSAAPPNNNVQFNNMTLPEVHLVKSFFTNFQNFMHKKVRSFRIKKFIMVGFRSVRTTRVYIMSSMLLSHR